MKAILRSEAVGGDRAKSSLPFWDGLASVCGRTVAVAAHAKAPADADGKSKRKGIAQLYKQSLTEKRSSRLSAPLPFRRETPCDVFRAPSVDTTTQHGACNVFPPECLRSYLIDFRVVEIPALALSPTPTQKTPCPPESSASAQRP